MKGDFSVWRYDPHDNDQGVLYQQGRVTLDRDMTDAERIAMHWRSQAAQDVIGSRVAAVPAGEPDGFFVESAAVVGGDVHVRVRSGRVWADGVLLYLPPDPANPSAPIDRVATYLAPPLNPDPLPPIGNGVRDVVILELALEELNAFQVPLRLLEPALGGPDTTERVTARYGFRLLRLGPNEDCTTILGRIQDGPAGKGRLSVSLDPPIVVGGECPTVEGGGYTGFEHNLFRVEVAATNAGAARIKWSRFNGGLVGTGLFQAGAPNRVVIQGNRAAIVNCDTTDFYLEALRFNQALGLWEVSYGAVAHLNGTQDLELTSPPVFGTFSFPAVPVFFRLWNGIEPISRFTNALSPVELVDGIHLAFDAPATATYRPGDYWTFPVRAGEIENPEQLLVQEPPHGVKLRRVPLAEINWTAAQDTTEGGSIEDCRKRFRPLTNQKVCCTFLIGDGVTSFGDFNSLEEAARHLPAGGGELCLLPGVHFANLMLAGRSNIRIHGCSRRTVVFPRLSAPADPIITLMDCKGIEIADMDLVSLFGAIVVGVGTAFGELDDVTVAGCRMLARTYAVQILRGQQIAIARNLIWMLDTTLGKAAIQVRAHRALIERNSLGVWPLELTPPPPEGGGDDRPTDPSDPCAEPSVLYGNLTWVLVYVMQVWTVAVKLPPVQPYRAWGGIHLLGGCEDVRVRDNRVDGGAGHGITLGGLLPGETGTPAPQDPANPPTVTLPTPEFAGMVQGLNQQPITGVDVSLSQGSVIRGQGSSAGAQGAVTFKVPAAGTYAVAVEPGYEIVSIRSFETGALRVHVLVVRTVPVVVGDERGFLYQIAIRENEILRMALSGIGFLPFAATAPAPAPPDLSDPAMIAAAFAAAFAPRILLGTTNIVRDLTIAENRLHDNLRVVFTDALRVAAREISQGGISLGMVENARITGNHVHDNGISAVNPVSGIFIGYGENVEICDNYVTGNGAITENYETEKVEGLRGGIYVRFASALLVGGESDAMQKPAVRITGNRVDQPAGRAVTVFAFGPVACQSNYLNSERTGRFNVFDLAAGVVLILDVGGLHRQQRFSSSNPANDFTAARAAELFLPGGEVLFNDNQIRMGTEHRSIMASLLATLDDLGFDGNQSNVFRPELLLANALAVAFTLRATDNRFREDTALCFFSLLTYSFGLAQAARLITMNTTAHNQGDHCIYAASNAPRPPDPPPIGLPIVYQGNMEANLTECRRALGEGAAANATLSTALVTTLFGQQSSSFDMRRYGSVTRLGVVDASNSVAVAGYEYRQAYKVETTRLEQTLGPAHPRVLTARKQIQRSGEALQQLAVATELAGIRETAAPIDGTVFDGRVTDVASRGKGELTVELVRADDTPVGVTARTDASGYFAMPIDAEQAKALAGEKQLFVRVRDADGNVLHRSATPVTVSTKAPVRATVVVARKDVPSEILDRTTVTFNRPPAVQPERSTPLESVRGIGSVTAARLRAAGIADVEALLRTPGERLVKLAGFDAEVLRKAAQNAIGTVPPSRTADTPAAGAPEPAGEVPPATKPEPPKPPPDEPAKRPRGRRSKR